LSQEQDLEAVVEAVLFVSSEPVSRSRLLEVFDARQREAAETAIDAVLARYRESPGRGFMIDEVAGGIRLMTRPDLHGYLRRFFEISGATKLSMAALETLSIIAYRQPVTGPEIQELRSVSSSGVLKTLLERRLIRIAGRKEVVGKPFLYATTREFLMHFGLRSLKELPPLEDLESLYATESADLEGVVDHEEAVLKEAAALEEAEDARDERDTEAPVVETLEEAEDARDERDTEALVVETLEEAEDARDERDTEAPVVETLEEAEDARDERDTEALVSAESSDEGPVAESVQASQDLAGASEAPADSATQVLAVEEAGAAGAESQPAVVIAGGGARR